MQANKHNHYEPGNSVTADRVISIFSDWNESAVILPNSLYDFTSITRAPQHIKSKSTDTVTTWAEKLYASHTQCHEYMQYNENRRLIICIFTHGSRSCYLTAEDSRFARHALDAHVVDNVLRLAARRLGYRECIILDTSCESGTRLRHTDMFSKHCATELTNLARHPREYITQHAHKHPIKECTHEINIKTRKYRFLTQHGHGMWAAIPSNRYGYKFINPAFIILMAVDINRELYSNDCFECNILACQPLLGLLGVDYSYHPYYDSEDDALTTATLVAQSQTHLDQAAKFAAHFTQTTTSTTIRPDIIKIPYDNYSIKNSSPLWHTEVSCDCRRSTFKAVI